MRHLAVLPRFHPRRLARALAFAVALLAALGAGARAQSLTGNFDPPLDIRGVDLGVIESGSGQHKEVRCFYYPHFMVKEVDQLEIGASQLSILASAPGMVPLCLQANMPGEHVIEPDAWSGYFLGAKDEYVVFRSADGANGGTGFAIFRSNDASLRFNGIAKGALRFNRTGLASMTVGYLRLHTADCSVPAKGESCVAAIAAATGAAPVTVEACRTGYGEKKRVRAHAWCEAHGRPPTPCIDDQVKTLTALDAVPSVVVIPFELTLREDVAAERPTGTPSACTPAD
jgi:hypothetical protein